jgi:predicted nucleic acid-binding protein
VNGILDTSVIIARSDEGIDLAALPDEAAISVATLAELHFGVLVARKDPLRRQRLRRLGEVEAAFSALPLDESVARAFATVAHAVRTAGRQPRARVMDIWVAATALAHGVPVFTQNRDDFKAFETVVDVRYV